MDHYVSRTKSYYDFAGRAAPAPATLFSLLLSTQDAFHNNNKPTTQDAKNGWGEGHEHRLMGDRLQIIKVL